MLKRLAVILSVFASPSHADEFDTILLNVTYLTQTLAWCAESRGVPMVIETRIPNIVGVTQERPKQVRERRGTLGTHVHNFTRKFSGYSNVIGALEIKLQACQELFGYTSMSGEWLLKGQGGSAIQSGSFGRKFVRFRFEAAEMSGQEGQLSEPRIHFLTLDGITFFKRGGAFFEPKAGFALDTPSE